METLGRAHLEDQAQYFLQFSDLKSLAYHSRRRFGDDDIQGATLHERLPALGHELGMAYAPTIEGPYRVLNNDCPTLK